MTTIASDAQVGLIERVSQRMRARRFSLFKALTARLPRPLRILDVGGRAAFWATHGWADRRDVQIVTGNIEPQQRQYENIEPVYLDATEMSRFADQSFDLVFSNSVIEHLFSWENQLQMAREVRRVGKAYWVQTPNYWFPLEPHFCVPGWQWLPVGCRVAILQRRTCGWRGRTPDPARARALVEEIRLVTRRELRQLFPDAELLAERFCRLIKSWVAVRLAP